MCHSQSGELLVSSVPFANHQSSVRRSAIFYSKGEQRRSNRSDRLQPAGRSHRVGRRSSGRAYNAKLSARRDRRRRRVACRAEGRSNAGIAVSVGAFAPEDPYHHFDRMGSHRQLVSLISPEHL